MEKHTINADGKRLGRIASEAAVFLMGKNEPHFRRNRVPQVSVHVTNAGKLDIFPKKAKQKIYTRFSGYPGGLKKESLQKRVENKGNGVIIRDAVMGMLPRNKLRFLMIKNLIISE